MKTNQEIRDRWYPDHDYLRDKRPVPDACPGGMRQPATTLDLRRGFTRSLHKPQK